jgi:predicted DNA-binding helix-hairpin-helix protein
MLIQSAPDRFTKLQHLGGMATDDVLSSSREQRFATPRESRVPARNRDLPVGVYKAIMPNGKTISLMRTMFTDFCMSDCFFCPNSHWVPRKRFGFTVDELATTFMELYERQTVAGLFLSSGIAGSPDKTMDKLVKTVEVLRKKHAFKGYIHLKVMPGSSYEYVEAASRLGTRLSVNIESPTREAFERLTTFKKYQAGILDPMQWVQKLIAQGGNVTVGQATQMVVGAADESDRDIFTRMTQLYRQWDFKRVYYQAFRPVLHTPLQEHPPTPEWREYRLYQLDWLSRIYGYADEELAPAFDRGGFLEEGMDPKLAVALEFLHDPVDINTADEKALLRVPGIGPTSVKRILENRQRHVIDTWRDLEAMGVVGKRAKAFVAFNGYKPTMARQLKLEVVEDTRKEAKTLTLRHRAEHPVGGCASCATAACGTCAIGQVKAVASKVA